MWYWIRGDRGIGNALSGARRAAGITQAQLADRLRANRSTIIEMEAGRNPAIARLIEAFNLMGFDLVAIPRGARVTVEEDSR